MYRAILKRILPVAVLNALRALRRRHRRSQWRRSVDTSGLRPLNRQDLIAAFAALGVRQGQDLLVHSALSRIGLVDGGADTVVDALLEVVGSTGTLLMPAYPMRSSMLETMQDRDVFDVLFTPSHMGKITEAFRKRPGVFRSAHPTHSVAAFGPFAEEYTVHHHLSGSPCGPRSPFRLLVDRGGCILCLGTGIGKVTSHHVIEDTALSFPVPVYLPTPLTKTVRLADQSLHEVSALVHDPKLARVRIDSDATKERELYDELSRLKLIRTGRVGAAEAHLFGARELNDLLADWVRQGRTIYAIP